MRADIKHMLSACHSTWYSDDRISVAAFKNIPVLVLSGNRDTNIPPIHHNTIYAKAVGVDHPVPGVSKRSIKSTSPTDGVVCPRMLVELRGDHLCETSKVKWGDIINGSTWAVNKHSKSFRAFLDAHIALWRCTQCGTINDVFTARLRCQMCQAEKPQP